MDQVNLRGRWGRALGGGRRGEGRPGAGGAGGSARRRQAGSRGAPPGDRGSGATGADREDGSARRRRVAGRDDWAGVPWGACCKDSRKSKTRRYGPCLSEKPGAQSKRAPQRRVRKGPL